MAKLIKISPKEKRTTIHDVEGIGTSARKKHADVTEPAQEFFAPTPIEAGGWHRVLC
jgi:hypothetical protein